MTTTAGLTVLNKAPSASFTATPNPVPEAAKPEPERKRVFLGMF